jgi:hypothetical protein
MSIENADELVKYEFKTKKGNITIEFEDAIENPRFKINGPKDLIHKVVGGKGFENQKNTETTVTEAHLKTEAQRMYAVLEIFNLIKE